MSDEPTLGEAVRRLDDVARRLDTITQRLDRRDTYIEENFVRASVWLEARKADQAMVSNLAQDIGAVQQDRRSDAGFRRQVLLALSVLAVTTLVSIALAVANVR